MQVNYKFTDKEIKTLLMNNLVIIMDSREQLNNHIIDYFDKKRIKYITQKLDAGDYSIKLTASPELGIVRDLYFPVVIEKKNSIDELSGSFKDRSRFEAEFIRTAKSKTKVYLLVEDSNGYSNIINGKYRSGYEPKAFLASLKSWEIRYNFSTSFIDKKYSGNFIYYTLRYYLYEFLKN